MGGGGSKDNVGMTLSVAQINFDSPLNQLGQITKIALNYDMQECSKKVYSDMKWLPLHLRRQVHLAAYMYRVINGKSPPQFMDKFSYISGGSRDGNSCNLYTIKSSSHKKFSYLGAKCWNILPQSLRHTDTVKDFSDIYKKMLLKSIDVDPNYRVNNTFDVFYEQTDGKKR